MKLSLWIYFTLAFFFLVMGTAFLPYLRFWAFAPFLAILFYRVNFTKALWISFLAGLLMDVFSSQFKFGLFALNHVIVSILLYGQKKHFFEDKTIAFSLYTALISCLLSAFLIILSSLSEKQILVSAPVILSDLFIMPFFDAIYAFIWFICPSSLYFFLKGYILKKRLSGKESE